MGMGKFKSSGTRMVVFLGLMIAFNVVFTRLLAVNLFIGGTLRLSLSFLPVVITSIVYGPYVGALGAAAADIAGMLVLPTGGAYFPGFTLNQALFGLLYGYFFKGKEISFLNATAGFAVPGILIGIFLKTYWLTILLKTSFSALLPISALNVLLLLPIQVAVLLAMKSYILKMQNSLTAKHT